nr:MAG TPA: hypothetical protein [Caudoviricetes sp.]
MSLAKGTTHISGGLTRTDTSGRTGWTVICCCRR